MREKQLDNTNSIEKVLKTNYFAFPYVWFMGVSFSLIETLTYQGFIKKHLLIDMKFLFLIIITSGIFMMLTSLSNPDFVKINKELRRMIRTFSLLVLPVFIIFTFVLYSLLSPNRNSIVFGDDSLIFPGRLFLATFLLVFFLFLDFLMSDYKELVLKVFDVKMSVFNARFNQLISRLFIILSIVWILIFSFNKDFRLLRFNVSSILKNPFATYDQKMENQIGPIYEYYKFVNENTPENAVILNPKQQGQWPDVSNQGFTRYFIYPRNLVSEEELKNRRNDITHAFMIGSKKLHDYSVQNSWPDFYIPAEKIIYFPNNDKNIPIVVEENYDPEKLTHPDYWGIIVIDKEAKW